MSVLQELQDMASLLATDLVNEISELLSQNKLTEALSAINDNKYNDCLVNNSWDLIPVLTKYLTEEIFRTNPELFQCCEQLLLIVAERSNPEEVLLEFIEQIESAGEDIKCLSILKATQKVLLTLTSKRDNSIEWTLNAIQSHIQKLPSPLETKEFRRISSFYVQLLPFYEPFVKEIALPNNEPKIKQRRDLMTSFVLRLLDKPFACLNFETDPKKNQAWICVERIIKYLNLLIEDCFKFLPYLIKRNVIKKKTNEFEEISNVFDSEIKTPTVSLGVYYYLILSENVEIANCPLVYNQLYIFQSIFTAAAAMLESTEQFVTKKALLLAHSLIFNEGITVLPFDLLDSPAHCLFCTNLMKLVVYSDVKESRELGIKIFKTYLFKFDSKGRYLLITNLMNVLESVNSKAYLITQFKDMLHGIFSKNDNKFPEYFTGLKLFHILDKFCDLPQGKDTDLMQYGDQIISVLNLLIYLTIRDKFNVTGICDYFDSLNKQFLTPLKDALAVSKSLCEFELANMEKEKGQGDTSFTFNVSGCVLPELSKEEKIRIYQCNLNSLDALEMLLVRLNELITSNS